MELVKERASVDKVRVATKWDVRGRKGRCFGRFLREIVVSVMCFSCGIMWRWQHAPTGWDVDFGLDRREALRYLKAYVSLSK